MKIEIPENIRALRLDIGASTTAPNTHNWCRDMDDCFVITVEPVYANFAVALASMAQSHNFNNTFFINAAIDDVKEPTQGSMYVTKEDGGCSSLFAPSYFELSHEEKVTKISLKQVLDAVDWKNFEFIEYLKTDTQGNEISVLKSMGEYLKKVVMIEVECTTYDDYVGAPKEDEIISFLEANNFVFYKNCEDSYNNGTYGDRLYVNRDFLHLRDSIRTNFQEDQRFTTALNSEGEEVNVSLNTFFQFYKNEVAKAVNVGQYSNCFVFENVP